MTTIPADLIITFILGLIFSISLFPQLKRCGRVFLNRYFFSSLAFLTIFCMPIAIYCYVLFPDWCWMYWVDSEKVPFYLVFIAFGFYYLSFSTGFFVGFYFQEKRMGLKVLGLSLIIFILFLIINFKHIKMNFLIFF